MLSVTEGRTQVPGVCTVVTVALVQAGTDELVFTGGGEYGEAQGERLLPSSSGPLVDADNEALILGWCAGVSVTLAKAGVDKLGSEDIVG